MKILRHIADKLYKYSSYYEKPKLFTIVKEQKQIIKVTSEVSLPEKLEERAKRILVSEMAEQLENLIKVEKISPNFEYPDLARYRGYIKVIEEWLYDKVASW